RLAYNAVLTLLTFVSAVFLVDGVAHEHCARGHWRDTPLCVASGGGGGRQSASDSPRNRYCCRATPPFSGQKCESLTDPTARREPVFGSLTPAAFHVQSDL